jgi:ABC-2 type transport system ATP-binding protein
MNQPVVEVKSITKLFKAFKAVDSVSFEVYPSEIVGIVGPNGAGKTTIIHMLLGLTTPNAGSIKIFGLNFDDHREEILEEVNFSSTYTSMPYSLTVCSRSCWPVRSCRFWPGFSIPSTSS